MSGTNLPRTIGSTVWRNLESVKTRSPALTGDVIISLTRVGNFVPQVFLDITKSLPASYMLARLVWKSDLQETRDRGGWSYEISDEMKREFYLGRKQQVRARKILRRLGCWEEKKMGVPAKLYMRVNWEGLAVLISDAAKSSVAVSAKQACSKGHPSSPVPAKLASSNGARKVRDIERTGIAKTDKHLLLSEISSETSPEIPLDRPSQDTRSASGGAVEKAERQFSVELKRMAKSKAMPGAAWLPKNPLRAEFRRRVYPDKVENVFFDSRELKFPDQLLDCIRNAVTQLANNMPGKMMHVSASEIENSAFAKLKASARTLELIPNFDSRCRQVTRAVINAVVEEAAASFEKKFPPARTSPASRGASEEKRQRALF